MKKKKINFWKNNKNKGRKNKKLESKKGSHEKMKQK